MPVSKCWRRQGIFPTLCVAFCLVHPCFVSIGLSMWYPLVLNNELADDLIHQWWVLQSPVFVFVLLFFLQQINDYLLNITLIFDKCLLSCGDTWQIKLWLTGSKRYSCKINPNRWINRQSFSLPPPQVSIETCYHEFYILQKCNSVDSLWWTPW